MERITGVGAVAKGADGTWGQGWVSFPPSHHPQILPFVCRGLCLEHLNGGFIPSQVEHRQGGASQGGATSRWSVPGWNIIEVEHPKAEEH